MVEEPQPYTSLKVLFLFTPSPCWARVSGRNEDFFFFQLAGDLIRTVALNRHGKDALDHISGFGVNQPLVSGFVQR